MKTALPAAILLVGTLLLGADAPAPPASPGSVLPPCYVPRRVPESDWRTVWIDPPRSFRLPPTFMPEPLVTYEHGGRQWKSGKRQFEIISDVWEEGSFGSYDSPWFPGYSECADTLAGAPFRLITTYSTNFENYMAIAVPVTPVRGSLGYSLAFIGQSPDSSDLELYLAIFRTLRANSIGSPR